MVMAGEQVGYGRPPKHGQFKKGTSGNPGGRPKKQETDLDHFIIEKLDEKIGDQLVIVLILKGAIKAAFGGDMKAIRLLLELYVTAKRRHRSITNDNESDRETVEKILSSDPRFLADLIAQETPASDK